MLRRIGAGGMAEVFLARERRPDGIERPVVLKRVASEHLDDRELLDLFHDEARLAMQFQHANVVQVFDCGVEDGVPFLAMEWLDGLDLRRLSAKLRQDGVSWPVEVAAAIGAGIARGLHYVHTLADPRGTVLRTVHRDLSPHNVMVTRHGGVKIVDFGVAKSAAQVHRTRSGVVKGKPAYLAPEQAAGLDVDARADLFALGTILWELLAGARLWERDAALAEEPAPAIAERRPDVPVELDRLIASMLSQLPQGRPRDARAVAEALDAIVHALGCRSPTDAIARTVGDVLPAVPPAVSGDEATLDQSVDTTVRATRVGPGLARRHTGLWIATACVLVVVAAAAAWQSSLGWPTPEADAPSVRAVPRAPATAVEAVRTGGAAVPAPVRAAAPDEPAPNPEPEARRAARRPRSRRPNDGAFDRTGFSKSYD